MKRTAKIIIITAAIIIVVGAVAFCGFMAVNHWDFSVLGINEYQTRTVAIEEGFGNISIDCGTEDVFVLPSENGKCSVVFYEPENEKHLVLVEKDTLSVTRTDTKKWYERILLSSSKNQSITLYLPHPTYAALLIKNSTGDITLPEGFTFESVDISADTGNIECCSSASGLISIKNDTGGIRCENISAAEINIDVSTGGVDMYSVFCTKNMKINAETGKIFLTDVSCKNIVSTASTGDITLENAVASGSVTIKRSTGDVIFKQSDAAELNVKTDTGDVTGSLMSDKFFIAKSKTGKVDVPETTSGGKCRITTNTGDIAITVS